MECDFCKTKYDGPYRIDCPECGFPVHGDPQQQAQFSAANAELKAVIDEADTALSWARFALLWPWLTVLALAAWQFLLPPANVLTFAVTAVFCMFFIGCYFAAPWRPVPVLILALTALIISVLAAMVEMPLNVIFIIPAFLLIAYSNALYTVWKSEKALGEKKRAG